MPIKSLGLLSIVICLSTSQGCKFRQDEGESTVRHTLNDPVTSPDLWQWTPINQAEFLSLAKDSGIIAESDTASIKLMPESTSLYIRATFWVDQIHAYLTSSFPKRFKNIPKPKVFVLKDSAFNAMVPSVLTGIKVDITFPNQEIRPSLSKNYFLSNAKAPFPRSYEIETPDVVRNFDEYWKPYLATFYDAEKCPWRFRQNLAGQEQIEIGEGCSNVAQNRFFSGFTAKTEAGAITIMSGLLKYLPSESQFVAVIAHELAHYYRAHAIHPDRYNYFYKMGKENTEHKPSEDPSLKSFGAKVISSRIGVADWHKLQQLIPSKIHASILKAMVPNIVKAVADRSCNAECEMSCEPVIASNFFKTKVLGRQLATAGLQFENDFNICANQIPLKISDDAIASTYESMNFVWSVYFKRDYSDFIKLFKSKKSLLELTLGLQYFANEWLKISEATALQNWDENIGWYTTEQEADELSTEWLVGLGFDPVDAVKAQLSVLFATSQDETAAKLQILYPAFYGIDYRDCIESFDHNWQDSAGKFKTVPIADYSDLHHSSCFRAYNLAREIRIHNYTKATNIIPPVPPGPTWGDLQNQVK